MLINLKRLLTIYKDIEYYSYFSDLKSEKALSRLNIEKQIILLEIYQEIKKEIKK